MEFGPGPAIFGIAGMFDIFGRLGILGIADMFGGIFGMLCMLGGIIGFIGLIIP